MGGLLRVPLLVLGLTTAVVPAVADGPVAAASTEVSTGTASATGVRASTSAQRRRNVYSPALVAIHGPRAWKRSTGHGVTVAVIDTGVAGDVANLRGRVLPGIDMVEPASPNGWRDEAPVGGHGTGVASVIAGSGRGIPVHGIAPGVQILPVRILDAHGLCPDALVAQGIVWATRHGADVINLSLGTAADEISARDKRREHAAVRYAVGHGVTVVAGAGNDGPDNGGRFYPAAFPEVIAVGGTNRGGTQPVPFSDRGQWVDVAAPAVGVWNANVDGTLGEASGTSFAAPAVSAMAALLLSVNPRLDPAAVRRLIMATSSDLGPRGLDRESGAGLVDAAHAVTATVRAAG
jgi:subtilisin family serine protease